MNSVRSIDLASVVAGSRCERRAPYVSVFRASRIRITQEDIENSGPLRKRGSFSIARLLNRTENAQSATKNSRTTPTSYRITRIHRVWEARGETTTRTTFGPLTGGATRRKVRRETSWGEVQPGGSVGKTGALDGGGNISANKTRA